MFNPKADNGLGSTLTSFLTGQQMVHAAPSHWEVSDNQDQSSPPDGLEYLTYGPGINELASKYTYDQGSHNLRMLDLVSPDALLVHQSRVVCFYVKLGEYQQKLLPIDRETKNLILKDARY